MDRLARRAVAFLIVGALALAPRGVEAQYAHATAVAVRSPAAPAAPVALPSALVSARPSRARHLWGGALLGGAAAGLGHVLYIRQQPKGQYHDIGYFLVPVSVVLGGAAGAGVGYLVYRARAG